MVKNLMCRRQRYLDVSQLCYRNDDCEDDDLPVNDCRLSQNGKSAVRHFSERDCTEMLALLGNNAVIEVLRSKIREPRMAVLWRRRLR